jgi:hypothetical protein
VRESRTSGVPKRLASTGYVYRREATSEVYGDDRVSVASRLSIGREK